MRCHRQRNHSRLDMVVGINGQFAPGDLFAPVLGRPPGSEVNRPSRLARVDRRTLETARIQARSGTGPLRLNLFDDVVLEAGVAHTAATSAGYSLSGQLQGVMTLPRIPADEAQTRVPASMVSRVGSRPLRNTPRPCAERGPERRDCRTSTRRIGERFGRAGPEAPSTAVLEEDRRGNEKHDETSWRSCPERRSCCGMRRQRTHGA